MYPCKSYSTSDAADDGPSAMEVMTPFLIAMSTKRPFVRRADRSISEVVTSIPVAASWEVDDVPFFRRGEASLLQQRDEVVRSCPRV